MWSKQYNASVLPDTDTTSMHKVIDALKAEDPTTWGSATTLYHGDFRTDNMIMHESKPEVAAVLDWELCVDWVVLGVWWQSVMQWLTDLACFVAHQLHAGAPTGGCSPRPASVLSSKNPGQPCDRCVSTCHGAVGAFCLFACLVEAVVHGTVSLLRVPPFVPTHPWTDEWMGRMHGRVGGWGPTGFGFKSEAEFHASGIPVEAELMKTYLARLQHHLDENTNGGTNVASWLNVDTGTGLPRNWNFFVSFALFRVAAILQGVYKRAMQGNAAAANAAGVGKLASLIADLSWKHMKAHQQEASADAAATAQWPSPVFPAPSLSAAQAHAAVKEFVNEEVRQRLLELGLVWCGVVWCGLVRCAPPRWSHWCADRLALVL